MNGSGPLIDERERRVVRLWRSGHLSWGSIRLYLSWVRRFRSYCQKQQLVETDQLTLTGVRQFTAKYVGPRIKRSLARSSCNTGRNALHAWFCALQVQDTSLRSWQVKSGPRSLPPLLREYCQYRRAHNGVAEGTLRRDLKTAEAFREQVRQRTKGGNITVADIDAFVGELSTRVSRQTVADTCSSLRGFLRFLYATDRLHHDLAKSVPAPRIRLAERPALALPWMDVRRILRSIPQSEAPGKRDFAMLLLMATYALGAAEVLSLRLEDVDWHAGILRIRRPKTSVLIELPILPQIAKALTAYLQKERPPAAQIRQIFLRANMPYESPTNSVIRHRIRYYARKAGVTAKVIGAHAFRHSHATRQVDAGANLKVVSDIMGHRRTTSTSRYVRVALRRLRLVALPVPRRAPYSMDHFPVI
jgi:integrase/recombinase XerD